MKSRFKVPLIVLAFLFPAFSLADDAPADHLKVEMFSEKTSIQPNGFFLVGFHFTMEKGWHIYWKNPGDSGLAPSIAWRLPEGFTAGPLNYPAPQRLSLPQLMDYGFEGDVLLTSLVQAPKNLKPGAKVKLSATVHWLVCKDICVPGEKKLSLSLPINSDRPSSNPKSRKLFQEMKADCPKPWPDDWKTSGTLTAKEINLSFKITGAPTDAWFIPETPGQVDNNAPQSMLLSGSTLELTLKRSDLSTTAPSSLAGLLVLTEKAGTKPKNYFLIAPLSH